MDMPNWNMIKKKYSMFKSMVILLLITCLVLSSSCNSRDFEADGYTVMQKAGSILVTDSMSGFEIEVIKDDIFKITYQKDINNPLYEESFAVIAEKDESVDYDITQTKDSLLISTSKLVLSITKEPFVTKLYKANGEIILNTVEVKPEDKGHVAEFKIMPGDKFYGMGQKSIPVDRKGYNFGTTNVHIGGYTKPYGRQQVNIPYVYSDLGYGVLFDNTWPGEFDFGVTDPGQWSYKASEGSFTYFVTGGESLQELQNNYYDLTGYPPLPPKWTLGLLQSKCGYESQAIVDSIADEFKSRKMPVDAIILDAYWFGGYKEGYPHYMGNFTWLKDNFPDHKTYLKEMEEKGIKTILINEPYINLDSKNYDSLAKMGYLVSEEGEEEPYVMSPYWAGDASMLDITNPGAQEWLWKQFSRLISEGVDGLWIDLTEPEYTIEKGQFHLGPERKVHNIYNNIFAETIYEGWRKDFPDMRVFNLTRAGFAGIQRYGAVNWSGDASKTWIALKLQVPMLIGCAMSGMPHYSSDIGGFTNAHDRTDGLTIFTNFDGKGVLTTPELYIRWFQFGVFSPSLRPHSGEEQYCEPFAHGPEAERISSYYLNWRYRLIPYLYTYAYRTTIHGEQLVKPLFMEYDDEACHGLDYQYLFGNEMMVAPVLDENVSELEVYFPELEEDFKWVNFWNDNYQEGGQKTTVQANLESIPVYVPQPSIVPLAKVKQYIDETPDDTITWRVYPGGYAEFSLYEDDGLSYNYEEGKYALTTIKTSKENDNIVVDLGAAEGSFDGQLEGRTWVFDVRLIESFDGVTVNGEPFDGYIFNEDDGQLVINYTAAITENIKLVIQNAGIK